MEHVPVEQAAAPKPFCHVGQAVLHPPQWRGDALRSTQLPEQLVWGKVQPAEQEPLLQTWPPVHWVEQVPHEVGKVRSVSQPSLSSWLQSAQPGRQLPMVQAPWDEQAGMALGTLQGESLCAHPR
jgi:hypothetical protein